jgi:hypothetical protein
MSAEVSRPSNHNSLAASEQVFQICPNLRLLKTTEHHQLVFKLQRRRQYKKSTRYESIKYFATPEAALREVVKCVVCDANAKVLADYLHHEIIATCATRGHACVEKHFF